MASTGSQKSQAPKSGLWAELDSLKFIEHKDVQEAPKPGSKAPSSPVLPLPDGRKTIILFLRHCGCPREFQAATDQRSLWRILSGS